MAAIAGTATDLVAYVNTLLELSAKPLDFSVEIKKGDYAAVVAAVAPKVDQLLAHDAETDVEGTFNMLFDVVRQLPKDDAVKEAKQVLATLTSKQDDKALLRLRIATNLFNKSVALPEVRFDALVAVITFASKSDNLELVLGYFDDVESLFAAKSLSSDKRRTLFLTIADVLQAADQKSLKVLLFLEKYLSTFTGEQDVAAGKTVALRATKLVLQHPVASFIARVDLISNPVVATLKGDKLYELLDIVSTKTLSEYLAFEKSAGAAFFQENALDAAELESTLRLFTLSTLPTGFEEIPYATVAKALSIEEDEVEQWVVKAITSNLVSAKIDQLKRTIVISRTLQRGFGADEWKEIQGKLQLYKKNVGALLDVVRNARQAHQNAGGTDRLRERKMVFVRFDFLIYGKIYFDFVVVAVAAVEVVVVDVERMEESPEMVSAADVNAANENNDAACAFDDDQNASREKRLRVDSMISISIDMEIDLDGDDLENNDTSAPDTDMIFAAATRGLLDGLFPIFLLARPHLEQEGVLSFPRDLEPLAQSRDRHGATLGMKKKEKASKAMAHMTKHAGFGHSRSPSRASSRAASRYGGGSTAAALAIQLAKLSSPLKANDPFRIVPWDERSETHSHTSHKTNTSPAKTKVGSVSGDGILHWSGDDYSARTHSLATTSRTPVDFHEVQRRQAISTELDARDTRQRIAREVHRKGDLKLKLRSLADPTISLEKEEAFAVAASKSNSLLTQHPARGTTTPAIATRRAASPNANPRPGQQQALAITADLPIPENITFRQEDYDGLESDVVLLEKNGELVVGENCFVVAKKPRYEMLLDLFQKSTVNPKVHLPLSPHLQESPSTEASVALQTSLNGKEKRLRSRQSPERPPESHNAPGRRGSTTMMNQDAFFDGQRGSFEAFPKLELDPARTSLAKGVTLKVDEAFARKQSLHQLHSQSRDALTPATKQKATKNPTAASSIQEHNPNASLENQLDAMMKATEKRKKQDLLRKKPSCLSNEPPNENQQSAPEHNKPEGNGPRPLSKHLHQTRKDLQNGRIRTPATRDRVSRKAASLKPIDDCMELDAGFGLADDHLYSLKEVTPHLLFKHPSHDPHQARQLTVPITPQNASTSLPKVKYVREFPSPPRGQIQVVHPVKASDLAGSAPFPFMTLPTVLKGKR